MFDPVPPPQEPANKPPEAADPNRSSNERGEIDTCIFQPTTSCAEDMVLVLVQNQYLEVDNDNESVTENVSVSVVASTSTLLPGQSWG